MICPMLKRSLTCGLALAIMAAPLTITPATAKSAPKVPAKASVKAPPNVVFILADDLDTADLHRFPNISKLAASGTTFSHFYVTNPWCCPSRSSILRAQYIHSHGVTSNRFPTGGFPRFKPLEESTIGTWMKGAGYRTALFGKYLNQYPSPEVPRTYIPPGWDEWAVPVTNLYREYGYALNDDGIIVERGEQPEDYLTDVLAQKAAGFVSRSDPFFLYLSPTAPHRPANHAPRHADAFEGVKAPRTPSYNQEDVSAEPLWVQQRGRIPKRVRHNIDQMYRDRLRSTAGLDDLVGTVVSALEQAGKLDDTYIFFGSDNGFHLGQHRLRSGKTTPYEEDIRVPMIVRGPGVQAGRVDTSLGSTVDLGPTFAELAGAQVPGFVEGRSLVPLLQGRRVPWRDAVLVEFDKPDYAPGCPPTYRALRTETHAYVEYATGERQLYDMISDPHQLTNLAATADPALIAGLSGRLAALHACSGAGCRVADTILGERSDFPPSGVQWIGPRPQNAPHVIG